MGRVGVHSSVESGLRVLSVLSTKALCVLRPPSLLGPHCKSDPHQRWSSIFDNSAGRHRPLYFARCQAFRHQAEGRTSTPHPSTPRRPTSPTPTYKHTSTPAPFSLPVPRVDRSLKRRAIHSLPETVRPMRSSVIFITQRHWSLWGITRLAV